MQIPEVESPKPWKKIDTERLENFLLTGTVTKPKMTFQNKAYITVINNPMSFGLKPSSDYGHCMDKAVELVGIIESGESSEQTELLKSLIEEIYG